MSSASGSADPRVQRLINHPAYRVALVVCGLPAPALDPHPFLTLALFDLWDAIRPHIALHFGMPVLASGSQSGEANLAPMARFQAIRPALVSPKTSYQVIQFINHLIFVF